MCRIPAFVLEKVADHENEAFVRDLPQNLKAERCEDVKTKLSCETSLKI